MPHALIRILEGKTTEQKKKLGEDVANAIAKGLGHPSFGWMVGYEIFDIAPKHFARGGKLKAVDPPPAYVIVSILKGRTAKQKKGIVEHVSTAVAKHLGVPGSSEGIIVEITEAALENISHAGETTLDAPPPQII
jgi:4-oxalocrotonate tautomerase family enzyme